MSAELSRREFIQRGSLFSIALALKPSSLTNGVEFFLEESERHFESTFLMYHEVSYSKFKQDLINLIQQGSQPISLETLIGYLNGTVKIPDGLSTFLVTCDDGRASQYSQVAPAVDDIERETGWFIPLTLFVMTKFEDLALPLEQIPDDTPLYNDGRNRFMTKGQLIEMIKRGHRVENHTVNHGNLSKLSEGARNAEVEDGERRIADLWKLAGREKVYKAFAYPYGVYQNQVEYIASLGYDLAFSKIPTTNHSPATRYVLGRTRKT